MTWKNQLIDSIANICKVLFVRPSLAFAAGTELSADYSGRILKSTDGGESWENIYDVPHRGFYDIFFVDSLFGVAVGAKTPVIDNFDSAAIYRTTDGGLSWTEVEVAGVGPLESVYMADTTFGWTSGDNAHLLTTTDGGSSWIQKGIPMAVEYPLYSIVALSRDEVWVTGSLKGLFHSTDAGITWKSDSLGGATLGLYFFDSEHGWAVGSEGDLWRYDFPTSTKDFQESKRPSFRLWGNYPNPFNPSTVIKFSLPEGSLATVRVYDLLGRLVDTLVESILPPGEHEVRFDAQALPTGIYLYTVTSRNYFASGKMILAK